MKTLKRSVGLLLVLAVFTLLVVAEASAKTTITLWTLFSGGEGFIMTDLVKKFNAEHPDIEVQGLREFYYRVS